MANRSQVPKWVKREKGKHLGGKSTNDMTFKKADARKKRPASNKGRGHQGGWAAIKSGRN